MIPGYPVWLARPLTWACIFLLAETRRIALSDRRGFGINSYTPLTNDSSTVWGVFVFHDETSDDLPIHNCQLELALYST